MSKSFNYQRRIYVPDTDYGGVVYHAKYLEFMDQARTEWLIAEGFPLSVLAEQSIHFIIRAAEISYLKPVLLSQMITISCSINRIGKTSFDFAHSVYHSEKLTEPLCQATVKVVCVNNEIKPVAIPAMLIGALT